MPPVLWNDFPQNREDLIVFAARIWARGIVMVDLCVDYDQTLTSLMWGDSDTPIFEEIIICPQFDDSHKQRVSRDHKIIDIFWQENICRCLARVGVPYHKEGIRRLARSIALQYGAARLPDGLCLETELLLPWSAQGYDWGPGMREQIFRLTAKDRQQIQSRPK